MKVVAVFICLIAQTAAFAATKSFSSTTSSPGGVVSDPKQALAKLVVENLKADPEKLSPDLIAAKKKEFQTILDELYNRNKGFSTDTVEGEWTSVLSLPGKKSRKQQSLVGKRIEKAGTTFANFVVDKGQIQVTAPTPRENGKIEGILSYSPVGEGYSLDPNGKIVLRRIACDNVKATFKYRQLPKVPIPFFKKKGGWLDFVYLDDDVRVTKGNLGGTFVHMRKEYLDQIMAEY